MSEKVAFRAHARLLTMLGEQLIKNERIALVELVKNAYDADATTVTVDFVGFGSEYETTAKSAIIITDNGHGMTREVVLNAWMNPATPSKAIAKHKAPKTERGRILQGEKGIGRFATFKLGNQVALVTRGADSSDETTLIVDISSVENQGDATTQRVDYFLDELVADLDTGVPQFFGGSAERSTHGTRIEVRGLRAQWKPELVEAAFADLDRMQPQLWDISDETKRRADFVVRFLRDGVDLHLGVKRAGEFQQVLQRAVLHVEDGEFDAIRREFRFRLGDESYELPIDEDAIRGLRRFRTRFLEKEDRWRSPECGSFGFEFYIFDFGSQAPARYWLDRDDKELLKEHRIYLYRDGIRVYPYGDPRDDWLEIDAIRGTESARSMFSNDQSVGYVTISQASNPDLRDKTNREGLLEVGNASDDFVALIQTILAFLRSRPYERYAAANRRAREKRLEGHRLNDHIQSLRNNFSLPDRAIRHLDELERAVSAERELSEMRIARTEQLAGVGMSVETASHDLIAAGGESLRLSKRIVSELELLDLRPQPVYALATTLKTRLEFVNSRFKDVQGLFVSTRQKPSVLDIGMYTRRIKTMYSGLHEHEKIEFDIHSSLDIKAFTNEAALMQCLINLVDNATYWLMSTSGRARVIKAYASDNRTLVITDSGPGVREEDEPYIFDPFYSGKGENGKGLGLYIARQNGARSSFEVALDRHHTELDLSGAKFVVKFGDTGEK